MNRRMQHIKAAVIATWLCIIFWPISLIRADGLTSVLAERPVAYQPRINDSTIRSPMAADYPKDTVLTMEPLQPVAIGDVPVITLHLTTASGTPIAKQLIRIFAYKNHRAQGLTDSTGTARIPLHFNFYPGTYDITAIFEAPDNDSLTLSDAFGKLVIIPTQVEIQTVPPLAGIQFHLTDQVQASKMSILILNSLTKTERHQILSSGVNNVLVKYSSNDQTLVSDANGTVHFTVDHIGAYYLEVLPVTEQNDPNVHVEFYRWGDNVFSTNRKFEIPLHKTLEAGFLISNPVNLQYFDQANHSVDPSRISLMSMRAVETSYTFKDPGKGWLPVNQLVHRVGSMLESVPATYYIENVIIDGSNVVNESQQRYQVQPNITWPIKLFLFSAYFSARDALFRFPIGSGIRLEYPDGNKYELSFASSNATIKVASLPRGLYHASVKGAGGIEPRMPMALSQNQDFELLVISRLDLAILLGIPVFVALFLLLAGRSQALFNSLRRRHRPM